MDGKSRLAPIKTDASLFSSDGPVGLTDVALRAYEEARISGLCHDGALEIALTAMARTDADSRLQAPTEPTRSTSV